MPLVVAQGQQSSKVSQPLDPEAWKGLERQKYHIMPC